MIYRKFYTSIDEILATTEIKKSRAMQYRAEHEISTLKDSVSFSLILSVGFNLMALLIYSWITSQIYGIADYPLFSYNFFIIIGFFILIVYPIAELAYLSEKENEAETPYHKVLRKIIRKLIEKVKGKVEAIVLFVILFYVIPIIILTFVVFSLDYFLFSTFIVFMIIPLIMVAYFIGYAIFRLFTSLIFLHNAKNIRLYVGVIYIGVIILFEIALLLGNTNLIFTALIAFLLILIYGIIKELKYRPSELSHVTDDVTRTFEWTHGSYLIFGFAMISFLVVKFYQAVNVVIIPASMSSIIENIILIQSILIPLFIVLILIGKSKKPSRALVVALANDSIKLNASIKSQFIHDKTLIETIEKCVNRGYIRPEYTPKLARLLQNEDTHIRRNAIVLLRKITEDDRFKSVSIAPKLLDFLKADKIWTVRLEAAESLTNMMRIIPKIEVKKIFEVLKELKPDKNRYVRWGIIKLFNSIALAREEEINEVLLFLYKGLEDEEWSVRKGTVESFNQLINNFPDLAGELLDKALVLIKDEDIDIIKELLQLIYTVTGIEVKGENLQMLESKINEKLQAPGKFNIGLLETAIKTIKETEKEPKFKFKKSDLKS